MSGLSEVFQIEISKDGMASASGRKRTFEKRGASL